MEIRGIANDVINEKVFMQTEKRALNLFTFIGVILMIVGMYFIFSTYLFISKAVRTEATVVDFKHMTMGGRSSSAPIIEFVTKTGEKKRIESSISSRSPGLDRGEKVEIFYNPNNFYQVKINKFLYLWFLPALALVLGLAAFIMRIQMG